MVDDSGLSEDDAHEPGASGSAFIVSAFIEVEPGRLKPLENCSRSQIETKIMSLTMQAHALIDEAKALGQYLDERER